MLISIDISTEKPLPLGKGSSRNKEAVSPNRMCKGSSRNKEAVSPNRMYAQLFKFSLREK